MNEQSRDTASFVRPPPPTTGEAEKKGRGPLQGLAVTGRRDFWVLYAPHISVSRGEWSPQFLNGGGPVRNFMNGASSEEVQAPQMETATLNGCRAV